LSNYFLKYNIINIR